MNGRAAGLVLELYPMAFRQRYGQEMRAHLDQSPIGVAGVLDLLRGALLAHLRPPVGLAPQVGLGDRLRASNSGVLACWVLFAAAGFGFYKTTEDATFRAAENGHRLLSGAHTAIQGLAAVASLAVVAGALPLVLIALSQARRRRRLRVLASLPLGAVMTFVGLTGLLAWLAHGQHGGHPTTAGGLAFIAWGLAGPVCGTVCVLASRTMLFSIAVPRVWLLIAFVCAGAVTVAMLAIAVAVAVYAIALPIEAPRLASATNGPLQAASVTVSLIGQLLVMAIACTLAVTTIRRGVRAVSAAGAGRL